MNKWLRKSFQLVNEDHRYLDLLSKVYPMSKNKKRPINDKLWNNVENAFNKKDHINLIKILLKAPLFPIKHSYVSFLKKKKDSIDKNPKLVKEIGTKILNLNLRELKNSLEKPAETNRQIGPMFSNYLKKTDLGIKKMILSDFEKTEKNGILIGTDRILKNFASRILSYKREKGLDLILRINNKYIIGEAKFITDYGGHQNAQFEDGLSTLKVDVKAEKIFILDGVVYINSKNKIYNTLNNKFKNFQIFSSIYLKDFIQEKLNEK